MNFDSYIISETKTSLSMPLLGFETCHLPSKTKHSKSFKRFAFTLAETLITLTIIGVIAALTVPNLLNKYTKHTYVIGLKKAYAQLQNAVKMIPITEGCSAGDYECVQNGIKGIKTLAKQYKTTREYYGQSDPDNTSNSFFYSNPYIYGFETEDGTIIMGGYGSSVSTIGIDINGEKGPNKPGRDVFYFIINAPFVWGQSDMIYGGTVVPEGSELYSKLTNSSKWTHSSYGCTTENVNNAKTIIEDFYQPGFGCAGRVLEEDAMNY